MITTNDVRLAECWYHESSLMPHSGHKSWSWKIVTYFSIVYIIIYINRFSDKEKQLFFEVKVSCRFIDNLQPTNSRMLKCYSALVSFWCHLTSLEPKWKTHPNPVMTRHIIDRSMKTSTPQVRDWAGTLASPPRMLKHKNVVYFPLPHKWSIIACS